MSSAKETSDALNPPVVEAAHVVVPARRRSAGDYLALVLAPWAAGWWTVVAGFVAFRVFDIWKPYPVRRLEDLGGGLGVMADDLLAGFYAAALMSFLISVHILF